MFEKLQKINEKPKPYQFYTAQDLWVDEYRSKQMLKYHLDEDVDMASRNIDFINKSSEWIDEKFGISKSKKVCDFGCGPGLYTSRFAQKGANVTGIDFSKNSIDYAKTKADENKFEINYVNMNYLDFESEEKFDLITMIMCDFCALSPQKRALLLKKFYSLLKSSGSVVLDVYTTKAFEEKTESAFYEFNQLNSFWSDKKYYGFVNNFKYLKEKVTLDKYTIIEQNKTYEIYNWLQYYCTDSIKKEFLENGFEVKEIYSNICGDELTENSYEMAVVAKKI